MISVESKPHLDRKRFSYEDGRYTHRKPKAWEFANIEKLHPLDAVFFIEDL